MTVEILVGGYDYVQAENDLRKALMQEAESLAELILQSAKSNIRYYPDVRNHLQKNIFALGNKLIVAEVTADYWQAWLEQFGKGSLMAGPDKNPGLITYMNSDAWNRLRSRSKRIVVGRSRGRYKSIDGNVRYSGGGYAGVDLEELAQRGDLDKKFLPTPPTFFLRIALQSNRRRIIEALQNVINTFPYSRYFRKG